MKHHVRTFACGAALVAAMALAGCSAQHLPVAEAPAMDHTAMDHAAMDHAAMDHSAMDHSNMAGMEHEASGAAIAATQPAATLRADEFDAPAPSAIEEAAKASDAAAPAAEHHHHGNGGAS